MVEVRARGTVHRIDVADREIERTQLADAGAALAVPVEHERERRQLLAHPGGDAVRAATTEAAVARIAVQRRLAGVARQGTAHALDKAGILRPDAHFLQAQHVGTAEARVLRGQRRAVVLEPRREVLDVPGHQPQAHAATMACAPRRLGQRVVRGWFVRRR